MPKLVIDEQEIEVPAGTKVIEAAETLGIMIPRFCYHPGLGAVGACRVCAVKFLQGPFKGIQMSCMLDALDGMVVSTIDEEAVDFRKHVIEWLMLNHPHDCPVCDEGGHCLLQDLTVAGGHGLRRYQGPKRTHHDQYLGPLLQHEMNRCIQCYRCSRFYQEFTGYRDLGVMQSASRVYFGRHQQGVLESPFAGNLSDICPTGVYTDKPSRFTGRRWDYERSPSLCLNCSLGCHTVASARYRAVVRQEARFSSKVNGYFICDRGRYGFFYASHLGRPRQAHIKGRQTTMNEALSAARKRLRTIANDYGPQALAVMGSVRSSLETLGVLTLLSRKLGWQPPAYWMTANTDQTVQQAVAGLSADLAVSLREIEAADLILVLGADPLAEAPMLALALRQAHRQGAFIGVVDPRPIELPFEFAHLPMAPDSLTTCLGHLLQGALGRPALEAQGPRAAAFLEALDNKAALNAPRDPLLGVMADALAQSQRPVLICGTDIVRPDLPAHAAAAARLLAAADKQSGLFLTLPGANAMAAALLPRQQGSLEALLPAIEEGIIRALVLVETDPLGRFPDQKRLQRALGQLETLVVLDYLNSSSVQAAEIFLPTTTLFESGGIFINQEGRAQRAPAIFKGGQPIVHSGGGSHPPRRFERAIPGGGARPAGQLLAELGPLQLPAAPRQILAELDPAFGPLTEDTAWGDEGVRIFSQNSHGPVPASEETLRPDEPQMLEVLLVHQTFGTEELSASSACLKELAGTPCVYLHQDYAAGLGLANEDLIAIDLGTPPLTAAVRLQTNMAPGILIVPRRHDLPWQQLGTGRILLDAGNIRKVTQEA